MDISSSLYTDYLKSTASAAQDMQKTAGLKTDYTNTGDEELMNACKQFEQYFIEQIYKKALQTVPQNDEGLSGADKLMRSYSQESLAGEYAKVATDHQSFGLAQKMFEQMKRSQGLTIEQVDELEARKATPAAPAEEA